MPLRLQMLLASLDELEIRARAWFAFRATACGVSADAPGHEAGLQVGEASC